jgi:hypothetical protein
MGGTSAPVIDRTHPYAREYIGRRGMEAAAEQLEQIGVVFPHPMIRDLVLNKIRSDWSNGSEDRVFTELRQWTDLTGAYRVVAAMKAASQPKHRAEEDER